MTITTLRVTMLGRTFTSEHANFDTARRQLESSATNAGYSVLDNSVSITEPRVGAIIKDGARVGNWEIVK